MKYSIITLLNLLLLGGGLLTFPVACEKQEPVKEETPTDKEDPDQPVPEKPDQPDPPAPPAAKTFMDLLGNPLSDDLLYSKAVVLPRNSVIQCFDIDKYGGVWYIQIAGNAQHQLNLVRATRSDNRPSEMMVFEYFGHGTNIALEEKSDGNYIWLGSYGTKADDGTYGGSQVFSRIKYKSGTTVQSGTGEHFCLPGERNIHPAINSAQGLLGITYTRGKSERYIAAYKMQDVMNLTPETMQLKSPIKFGGEDKRPEKTEQPTINARDLSRLTPLYCVEIGYNANGLPFQGFDVEKDKFYYYEGAGNGNSSSKKSSAFVVVMDKNGKQLDRKEVKAASDPALLKKFGLADRGYFEGEGIKVKRNILYLGAATRKMSGSTDQRLANILRYKL